MTARDIFWFLAGILAMAAVLLAALPWLRESGSAARALRAMPRWAYAAIPVALGATAGIYLALGNPGSTAGTLPAGEAVAQTANGSAAAAEVGGGAMPATAAPGAGGNAAAVTNAGSMSQVTAGLEAKLAKGGGDAGSWELLAKSYEFLNRPADAALARQHKLPPGAGTESAAPAAPMMAAPPAADTGAAAAAAGARVSGEVQLAPALRAKVKPGMTLYIVAKGVGMPGAPLAVWRTTTGTWPLAFELSDANAMLPGRNLSAAAQVTVEARISLSGLANSQPGDLLGTAGPFAPAGSKPLRILIQKVVE